MSKWEVKHEKKEIFEVRFEAANLVHDVFEGIRVPQPWIYERDCGCMRRVWNGIKEEEGEWGTKTRVHAPNARIPGGTVQGQQEKQGVDNYMGKISYKQDTLV